VSQRPADTTPGPPSPSGKDEAFWRTFFERGGDTWQGSDQAGDAGRQAIAMLGEHHLDGLRAQFGTRPAASRGNPRVLYLPVMLRPHHVRC